MYCGIQTGFKGIAITVLELSSKSHPKGSFLLYLVRSTIELGLKGGFHAWKNSETSIFKC